MSSQRTTHAWISAAIAALTVAGCAAELQRSAQRPEEVTRAIATVDAAERAGAYEQANVELTAARRKLADAEKALQDGRRGVAARLGEEADLDAQLAMAKARNAEMQSVAAELNESIRRLQEEVRRGEAETLGRL